MDSRGTRLLLTALACAVVGHSQTSTTSGAIRGVVRSKRTGPVANATMVLRNVETGFSRTLTTSPTGEYQFVFLPIGRYELTATAPGLKAAKDSNVRVTLGQTTNLNFSLDTAEAAAVVEVVAEAGGVDTAQINTATSITSEVVEAIPINGRDFTNLVLLTPGAATNSEGYRQTVEGARGVQNNLQIDGMSFNSKFNGEQRGGTRIPNAFGQDTIRELQVVTNSFDAQYGDAAGAIINAVSKTGTNEISGSAFTLFRPNALIAHIRPTPAGGASQNLYANREREYDQFNAGFTLGGPIIKDKLHYFVGAEYVVDRIGSLSVLTPGSGGNSQGEMDRFFGVGQATLDNSFGANLLTTNDGRSMSDELGQPWTNERKNLTAFGRLDWVVSNNHRATLRVNSQTYKADNNTYSGQRRTDVAESNNARHEFKSISIVGEFNSIISANLVNEARFQYSKEQRPSTPNSTASSEIRVGSSSATFRAGQYYIEPRNTEETTLQFQDNLTWMSGDWTLKGGVDFQFIHFKNLYYPNKNGSWTFGSYQIANNWFNNEAFAGSYINYYQNYSPLNGISDFREEFLASYAQAQYAGLLNKRLLLSLGLRFTAERWDDNPNPNPKLQGLDKMPDTYALDPRFGFTLDVRGDGRTVIRGGYGWFSVSNPAQTTSGAIMNNGINMLAYKFDTGQANQLAYFTDPNGILTRSARFTANGHLIPMSAAELVANQAGAVAGTIVDPEARMARAEAASLGVEHDFNNGWRAGIRGTYKEFSNLQYFLNVNLAQYNPGGTLDPTAIYNDGYTHSVNRFSTDARNRPYRAMVRGRLLDLTGFGDMGLSKYDGEGRYRSVVLEGSYRGKGGWGFNSSLTFAKAEDNNSNERATAQAVAGNTFNPADPLSAFALSDNDRKMRGTFYFWMPKVWGFKLSGLFTYTTGRPWTAQWANDVNGDGVRNDPAFNERNTMRQPHEKSFDLRLSRFFRIYRSFGVEGQIDVFNVLNWANQRTSKYNYGSQPAGTIYSDFGAIDVQDSRSREVQFTLRTRW